MNTTEVANTTINNLSTYFSIVSYVLLMVANWRIFQKAGKTPWLSLIPIVNLWVMYDIAMRKGWMCILLLIPVVNIVVLFFYLWKLSKAFGKGVGFFVASIFVPNITLLILGFDGSTYLGPQ